MMELSQEADRLRALRNLNLLDTAPNECFDRITRMASEVFDAPISAISLTDEDRQWFKSRVGCGSELPREKAPCAEVTRTGDLLIISDLSRDVRFQTSDLIRLGVRFYAGAPLTTMEGFTLGAMCVLDTKPRRFTSEKARLLTDLAAMVMAQIELQHAFGRIDAVSGLPNRNQYAEDLHDMVRDHRGEPRVAILVDLAGPLQLTQAMRALGPSHLDEMVRTSVATFKAFLGKDTTLYHVGATQFGAILDCDEARLKVELEEHFRESALAARRPGIDGSAGVTVGVAPFRLGAAVTDVLRAAHSAAQDAREADLCVGTYSLVNDEEHRRRYALIAGMREMVDADDQLSLVYQPRIDLLSGRCDSAEALLRWRHPVLGDIAPSEFIPLAEQAELMRPITRWVVTAALRQLATWRTAGFSLRVSVNVSAANLEDEDFASGVATALVRHDVPPSALEIEFTESVLIRNRARILRNLKEIRSLGVRCAIDDFGTGYSSFSYLQEIPAEIIKIDQSFIRNLSAGTRGSALVRNMIIMARELGYRVVAEGVKTREAYDVLSAASCDEAQGYLISPPISPAAFIRWILDRDASTARNCAA